MRTGLLEALEISQILQGQITALRPRNVPGATVFSNSQIRKVLPLMNHEDRT